MTKTERERSLAVFIDLENLAMGFQNQRKIRFEVQKVLERLVEKGKLIVKKAYADWSRYPSYTAPFHEAAIELIEIPKRSQTGKNSADIRLVVDAMDLAWSKPHVDTFVIVSGDSDFSPAGVEAQGERQACHRAGHERLDRRPAPRQLRRIHLLRRPGTAGAKRAAAGDRLELRICRPICPRSSASSTAC